MKIRMRQRLQQRACMAFEMLFRRGAIEEDMGDCRVALEEGGEVVNDDRIGCDVGIQAAAALAGLQHIPQRNAGVLQRLPSQRIRHRG